MKIEKVNDHQIRCTLTREDLADRELKLSELAYGTEKAKDLFRDMMQQASFEFGFEAEDIPLMIEAIPLSSECIVLIITKVEDPDELDTRFSKFAPSVHEEDGSLDEVLDTISEGADDVLDLFKKIQNDHAQSSKDSSQKGASKDSSDVKEAKKAFKDVLQKKLSETAPAVEMTRIYLFHSLHEVTAAAHVLSGFYTGISSLFKQKDSTYLLVISKGEHTPVEYNKVCNILSEYGSCVRSVPASEAYLEEHFEPIIRDKAVASLSRI